MPRWICADSFRELGSERYGDSRCLAHDQRRTQEHIVHLGNSLLMFDHVQQEVRSALAHFVTCTVQKLTEGDHI